MADYIYLLENRLSGPQRAALLAVRELARSKGLTVFLVGGAVRDLTSGSPVRDLDVAVQGNAFKLKKDIEKMGLTISGEGEGAQALFVRFPGGVAMEIGSTLSATYPKPGKPVYKAAGLLEDLRRRDFTANAMALSLNEGSYGLLMDPLNGVADIENRELRLVSNYGFIEEPVRMIRAARFSARLGWQLEEKTRVRYETGKEEEYIGALSEFHRGYEAEELVHEEDPLRVIRRLEAEGWMKALASAWTSAKVNVTELEKLREAQMQLQMQGVAVDPSAAQFPLLTSKMSVKEVADLKAMFPRRGFVAEIEALEGEAKQFATEFGSKAAASPSASWKLLTAAKPGAVLWTAYATKSPALQAKFKSFYTEWPTAKQKIPYALLQEMRIVPELPVYNELLDKLFFELMDGKLGTAEEMKAFLEPYSPPAPPPPVSLRRARATKKEAKPAKSRKKAEVVPDGEAAVADAAGVPAAGPAAEVEPAKLAEVAPVIPPAKPAVAKAAPAPETAKTASKSAPKSAPAKAPVKSVPVVPAKKMAAGEKAGATVRPPAKLAAKAAAKKVVPAKKAAPSHASGGKKAPASKQSSASKGILAGASPAKKVAAKQAAPAGKATTRSVAKKAPIKAVVKKTVKAASKAAVKPSSKTRR